MFVRTFVVSCPFEGLFIKHVATFVGNDVAEVSQMLKNKHTVEFDGLRDFLCDSSEYNNSQMNRALKTDMGYLALIDLAQKWGWTVTDIKSEV